MPVLTFAEATNCYVLNSETPALGQEYCLTTITDPEVVSFGDLVDAGSMAEAKARGRVRIEGKDYVMADGDVVEFRFNV